MKGTAVKPTRILVAAGACLAVVALAACSSSKPAAATSAATSPAALVREHVDRRPCIQRVGVDQCGVLAAAAQATRRPPRRRTTRSSFVQGVAGDNFYITMQCGIQAEAKKLGVTVNTQGPPSSTRPCRSRSSTPWWRPSRTRMLIAPTDVMRCRRPLRRRRPVRHQGRAWSTPPLRTRPTPSPRSPPTTRAGGRGVRGDQAAGPQRRQGLVHVRRPRHLHHRPRVRASRRRSRPTRKFNYLGVQYSHNDPATAAQLMTAALQKDPDMVGIFATNLFSAEGAATGIKQAGKQAQVKIVGFDAAPTRSRPEGGTVQALDRPGAVPDRRPGPGPGRQRPRRGHGDRQDPDRFYHHHPANVATTDAAYKASC